LAQSWVVRPKTISQQLTEPANHIGRNATLAGGELSLQGRNVGSERGDPLAVMGQTLGEVAIAR
jgi:hypothetical protein